MSLPLRDWYYKRFVKRELWPEDVRGHILRAGLKKVDNSNPSAERQQEVAIKELTAALSDDNLGPELTEKLLDDGLDRLRNLPLTNCKSCGISIFKHEAIMVEGKPYCESCKGSSEQNEP